MRKRTAILLAIVMASNAKAQTQSLQGHWSVRAPSIPSYIGIVLIDADGRATWDSPKDRDKRASFLGYVSRRDGHKVEMLFTNGLRVTHTHCVRQSSEAMNCYNVYQDGTPSDGYTLVRVGPGPSNLMRASQ